MIDREYSGSISTRKLVIETAKFNVLTAYSASEAVEILKRFPGLDGVVMNCQMPDMSCTELVGAIKKVAPRLPVIVVGAPQMDNCDGADHELDSFDPKQLLGLLEKLRPEDTAAIEKRNEELQRMDSDGHFPTK